MQNQLTILLVDDDEDEYILLKSIVSRLPGIETDRQQVQLDWAPDLQSALAACRQKKFDLFLLDFFLGRHNAFDLMRELNEQGIKGPFILLTGQGSYEIDREATQRGAADYLTKDQINEHLLERSIRYAMERFNIQNELAFRVAERTAELARLNAALEATVASLRESENRFRALTEMTSAGIFILQSKIIRYANPAARLITGYPPEELLGREFWKLAHPTYQEILKSDRFGVQWVETIPVRYEVKMIHRTGEERWLDLTVGRFPYESAPAWLITAFDITERDRAEQELKRAREDLERRLRNAGQRVD